MWTLSQTIALEQAYADISEAFAQHDTHRARALIDGILKRFPKDARATEMLGKVGERDGHAAEAISRYVVLTQVHPLRVEPYAALARLLSASHRHDLAGRYESIAADHQSGDGGLVSMIAGCEVRPSRVAILNERSGLVPQATDGLRAQVEKDHTRTDLYLLLARCLYRLRLWDECEATTALVLNASPDCLEANVLAAALCYRSKRKREASGYLAKAVAVDPSGRDVRRVEAARDLPDDLMKIEQPILEVSSPEPAPAAATAPSTQPAETDAPIPSSSSDAPGEEASLVSSGNERQNIEPSTLPVMTDVPVAPVVPPVVAERTETARREPESTTSEPSTAGGQPEAHPVGPGTRPVPNETGSEEPSVTPLDRPFGPLRPRGPTSFVWDVREPWPGSPTDHATEHLVAPPSLPEAYRGEHGWQERNGEPQAADVPTPRQIDSRETAGMVKLSSSSSQPIDRESEPAQPARAAASGDEAHAARDTPYVPASEINEPSPPSVVTEAQTATTSVAGKDDDAPVAPEDHSDEESHRQEKRRSFRRWAMPGREPKTAPPSPKSPLPNLAETVGREPLNNGARFELAKALTTAGAPDQAVSQYGLIIESHDPRLVGPVREELERLLTSGVKVHGLQRLLGDAYMQQGAYERAIESYSLAFDELRSRQITEGIRA